jgi:hypothetical protein
MLWLGGQHSTSHCPEATGSGYLGHPRFKSRCSDWLSWLIFCGFPQSLRAHAVIVSQISPYLFTATSFLIHCSHCIVWATDSIVKKIVNNYVDRSAHVAGARSSLSLKLLWWHLEFSSYYIAVSFSFFLSSVPFVSLYHPHLSPILLSSPFYLSILSSLIFLFLPPFPSRLSGSFTPILPFFYPFQIFISFPPFSDFSYFYILSSFLSLYCSSGL